MTDPGGKGSVDTGVGWASVGQTRKPKKSFNNILFVTLLVAVITDPEEVTSWMKGPRASLE